MLTPVKLSRIEKSVICKISSSPIVSFKISMNLKVSAKLGRTNSLSAIGSPLPSVRNRDNSLLKAISSIPVASSPLGRNTLIIASFSLIIETVKVSSVEVLKPSEAVTPRL